MSWLKNIFKHHMTIEEKMEERFNKKIAEYQNATRVFCRDCLFLLKPGSTANCTSDKTYSDYHCLAIFEIDYVTGEKKYDPCNLQNINGRCHYYKDHRGMKTTTAQTKGGEIE